MTFEEYQNKAKETAIHAEQYKVMFPVMGLAGEAGEVANKASKIYRDDNGIVTEAKKEDLTKELGDVLWYLSQIATDLGIPLEEVARNNLEKLESRKQRNQLIGSGDNR
ncbi:MAG: nucleoside triphosphate pyrophosphohydrolase family protein [Candidatus Pacebacteria bacterium]|nr:nucleoside triphosphate pyrophosphohydrolase family protein [Candidatus Paceibacterota bacterium]